MNAQTTIRVRTQNSAIPSVGQHMTLIRVSNSPNSIYAFAMMDDGSEVYIPARIVAAHNMQPEDADNSAGFTAPIRPNPRGLETGSAQWIVTNPLKWDGDAEEMVVTRPDGVPQISQDDIETLEADLNRLADAADENAVQACNDLQEIIKMLKSFDVKGSLTKIEAMISVVESFRVIVSEIAPSDDD